jgi:hypothetical protein
MINTIIIFSLIMCATNWLMFLSFSLIAEHKLIGELIAAFKRQGSGMGETELQAAVDLTKLAGATGDLAGAFKKAGAAPTAAALSVLFLLAALIAAGLTKV